MSADNMNVQRGGTGRLNAFRATAPLPALESTVPQAASSLQGADSISIATPPQTLKYKFSERSNSALSTLSSGVQRLVTTHRIAEGMPDKVKERQVIENLKTEINKMVPGGVKFEEAGGKWKVPELVSLYQTVNRLPAADRMALTDTTFRRAGRVSPENIGYAAAAAKQFGTAVGAEAVGGTTSVEAPKSDQKTWVGHLITRFEEYKEKVKNWLGMKSTPVHADTKNGERVVTLTNAGALVSDKVYAHEIGHQLQMADGRWDPEKIKEFSKLSRWTEAYADGSSSIADGIDNETGRDMQFDARVKPQREDNFVTKYALTSPTEDFAESYSAFVMDPKSLMEKSPDKFLLINANARHYSSEQVQAFAKEKGIDLQATVTKLVLDSGLKQESLDKICQVNQISADKAAVLEGTQANKPQDALGEVSSRLTEAALKGEQAFLQGVLSDPQSALGEAWGRLNADEQAMLKDPNFVQSLLNSVQLGRAGSATLSGEIDMAIARDGVRTLMLNMVNADAKAFRAALAEDPEKVLKSTGIWDKLPDEMRGPLVLSSNRTALKAMLAQLDTLSVGEASEQNIRGFVEKLSPESFTAFAQQLGDQDFPQRGAENIASIMSTGMALNEVAGTPPMA